MLIHDQKNKKQTVTKIKGNEKNTMGKFFVVFKVMTVTV